MQDDNEIFVNNNVCVIKELTHGIYFAVTRLTTLIAV
jgi:hypothetical protein